MVHELTEHPAWRRQQCSFRQHSAAKDTDSGEEGVEEVCKGFRLCPRRCPSVPSASCLHELWRRLSFPHPPASNRQRLPGQRPRLTFNFLSHLSGSRLLQSRRPRPHLFAFVARVVHLTLWSSVPALSRVAGWGPTVSHCGVQLSRSDDLSAFLRGSENHSKRES
ncbi:hypothetical protein Mp_6g08980 [Marchantia polymorpha subsp. ruderalis]|uniref:Uncharacterized protein n=2 Tax=Marchantia polymorpha TaxID=3197 RepID=A0AAF6BQ32_MARPO|nr:hypothetical protein MARPO_0060s0021 [Marchantia polymorpha]BBN14116.1 hypothetical protein Mp_6g08980 [Marchantia polymorpha subsp. ruderalis]|eukprot:PTQ36927.1 hypothetical protein MARPO_0060s0021 [Marchantia polymorpha]